MGISIVLYCIESRPNYSSYMKCKSRWVRYSVGLILNMCEVDLLIIVVGMFELWRICSSFTDEAPEGTPAKALKMDRASLHLGLLNIPLGSISWNEVCYWSFCVFYHKYTHFLFTHTSATELTDQVTFNQSDIWVIKVTTINFFPFTVL